MKIAVPRNVATGLPVDVVPRQARFRSPRMNPGGLGEA